MALERFSLGQIPARQQVVLFGLILAALSYFPYTWFVQPLSNQVQQLEKRIENLRREVQEGQLVEAKLPQFRKELEAQRAALEQFRSNLPSEKETPVLMDNIQSLAVETSLNIKSFIPQKTISREFYVDWPIQITLEGNYHNLAEFFERVSRISRLVNIGQVDIQAVEDTSIRQRTIAAACTATTFVFLEEEAGA